MIYNYYLCHAFKYNGAIYFLGIVVKGGSFLAFFIALVLYKPPPEEPLPEETKETRADSTISHGEAISERNTPVPFRSTAPRPSVDNHVHNGDTCVRFAIDDGDGDHKLESHNSSTGQLENDNEAFVEDVVIATEV